MKKILVCEDEEAIRDVVVINLQRAGYDTTAVSSGEEAIEAFDAQKGDFDIALLDIMMPGIDGFTVCKSLREKSDNIGIILLISQNRQYIHLGLKARKVFQRLQMTKHFQGTSTETQPRKALLKHGSKDFEQRIVASSTSSVSDSSGFGNIW